MDFGRVRRASISALILFCGSAVAAQEPLPLDTIHSWEAEQLSKPVVRHKALPISSDLKGWHHEGKCGLSYAADGQLQLHVPASTGLRAKGSPDDPDYATYGRASVSYSMNDADLEGYDRITLEAFPSCEGTAIMNLNILLHTDEGAPLGAHLVNLRNNRSGLPRKHVRRIEIYTDLKGRNQAQCDTLTYIIRNIRLEQVQHPEAETGWEVAEGHIAYSHSGYYTQGAKTALIKLPETQPLTSIPFHLEEAGSSTIVYTGTAKATTTTIGTFGVMDFTPVSQPGNYRLTCGNVSTPLFASSTTPFEHAAELLLNFLYCQRCGHAVPGIHGRCHTDVYCRYDGNAVSYSGGWHDAGDLSQQTLQTCETAISLLEAWQKAKATGSHLAARLLKESVWGLRFVLKNRLGNGYHASSIGLLHWTDSEPGTADDIYTVRKQDCSYDNFLYAAYESYAARHLPSGTLRDSLAHAAREDYDYALAKYEREGIGTYPHIMEHTYNTSPSQYHATMSWSATELFLLTGEARYSKTAADAIDCTLHPPIARGIVPAGTDLALREPAPPRGLCQMEAEHPFIRQLSEATSPLHRPLRHDTLRRVPKGGICRLGWFLRPPYLCTLRLASALRRPTSARRQDRRHPLCASIPYLVQHLQRQRSPTSLHRKGCSPMRSFPPRRRPASDRTRATVLDRGEEPLLPVAHLR